MVGHGAANAQIGEVTLVKRGKRRHGKQLRGGCAEGRGGFRGGLNHGLSAGGVQRHQVHAKAGASLHGTRDGAGDIVQFEVEKDALAGILDHSHHVGALGGEELQADFVEIHRIAEAGNHTGHFGFGGDIKRNNKFCHIAILSMALRIASSIT